MRKAETPILQKSSGLQQPDPVMYMSHLSTFLQNVKERESSVHEKALNFGVLDWESLEKDPNMTRHVSSQSWSPCSHFTSPQSQLLGSSAPSVSESKKSYGGESDETAGNRLSDFFELYTSPDAPGCCPPQSDAKQRHKATFSLGRISRNSSFRESSACSSVESGGRRPEFEGPLTLDRVLRDHVNVTGRGRSSSLLRLFDPILKRKTPRSAEVVGSSPSSAAVKGQDQNKQPEMQALVQLGLKDELPFYKFVVGTRNTMLVAAAKKLWSSGKSDPSVAYTFYSVSEIKKKGMNWITRGKACSLAYNTVGQMTISRPRYPEGSCCESGRCETRECLVYCSGGQQKEKKKQVAGFAPGNEIAAIITRTSSDNCDGTVVILPDGVHGAPLKGSHSSLISRWKSGGSCDCGGWDVGCKLQVLGERHDSTNNIGDMQLFSQGQEHRSRPVFSMEQLNSGMHSIIFDVSVPLVDAFAIFVAQITCRRYSGVIDECDIPDPIVEIEKKAPEPKPRAKYASCPPLSPAGRI